MSDPRTSTEHPQPQEQPVAPSSLDQEVLDTEAPDSESLKVAPWTSETSQVPRPAPMIDLDTPDDAEPVKPLGPRRLARLQRQMAEHVQEIQDAERTTAGEVDPDLLIKQRRLADLALRAAAANEEDRQAAAEAVRMAETQEPAGGSAEDHGDEQITVVFPQSPLAGSPLAADPLAADPGQFPSSPVDFTPAPGTTSIQVIAGDSSGADDGQGDAASTAVAPAAGPATDGDFEQGMEDETVEDHQEVQAEEWIPENDTTDGPLEAPDPDEVAEPRDMTTTGGVGGGEEPGGSTAVRLESTVGAAASVQRSGEPQPLSSEQLTPPAMPVRALDAEGLELLEPQDYRQSSGALVPLLILVFLLLAALVTLLIVFVL